MYAVLGRDSGEYTSDFNVSAWGGSMSAICLDVMNVYGISEYVDTGAIGFQGRFQLSFAL